MVVWTPGKSLKDMEKEIILASLKFHQNNKTAVANSLEISIRTIDNKLKTYGLECKGTAIVKRGEGDGLYASERVRLESATKIS